MTIPQRLREIAGVMQEGGLEMNAGKLLSIAAELEAPVADVAMPVVAMLTDGNRSGAIRVDRVLGADGFHALTHSTDDLVRARDARAAIAERDARINALEQERAQNYGSRWVDSALYEARGAELRDHVATVAALQARIDELEARWNLCSACSAEAGGAK